MKLKTINYDYLQLEGNDEYFKEEISRFKNIIYFFIKMISVYI